MLVTSINLVIRLDKRHSISSLPSLRFLFLVYLLFLLDHRRRSQNSFLSSKFVYLTPLYQIPLASTSQIHFLCTVRPAISFLLVATLHSQILTGYYLILTNSLFEESTSLCRWQSTIFGSLFFPYLFQIIAKFV